MNAQQLKNSILQMAVSGKLVPQDPNDEPASVLLERIRKEKEQLIKEGKIKKEKNPSYIFRGADNTPYEKVGNAEPVSIADEVPFEIPESWEWCRLGTISTYAQTKKKINAKDADPDMWGLDLEDIEKGGRLLFKKTVGERKAIGDKTIFEKGDILYSKLRPYLLKIMVADENGVCTPEIVPFRAYGGINSEYLVAYLQSPYVDASINAATYGIKMPRAGTETMTALLVPVPPLQEQQRIVSKLKEVTPQIEKYNRREIVLTNLNAEFPAQLKKSILQLAVQGKLVPQDPNDEPASVLLDRIRAEKERLIAEGKIKRDKNESVIYRRDNSHYEKRGKKDTCIDELLPFDIPDSWCWCRLINLCETIFDIDHNMPKDDPDGILFLSAKDLLDDGSLNFDVNVKRISRIDFVRLSKKGVPQQGDIIYSRIGARLGKARIVYPSKEFLVSYSCCTIRPLGVDVNYLQILLDGGFVLQQAKEKTQSIGVPDLGMQMIKDFWIPLPPLTEQKRIVEKYHQYANIIATIS